VRVADLNGTSGTLKPRQLARLTTGSYGLSFEHEVERHEYYGPEADRLVKCWRDAVINDDCRQ
jgi:hypothetical protein